MTYLLLTALADRRPKWERIVADTDEDAAAQAAKLLDAADPGGIVIGDYASLIRYEDVPAFNINDYMNAAGGR